MRPVTMAMTQCPECSSEVDPKAFVCAKCGGPLITPAKVLWPETRVAQVRRLIIFGALIALGVWQALEQQM